MDGEKGCSGREMSVLWFRIVHGTIVEVAYGCWEEVEIDLRVDLITNFNQVNLG